LPDGAADCPRCGIIVAKYLAREDQISRPLSVHGGLEAGSTTEARVEPERWAARLLDVDATPSMAAVVGRGIFFLCLSVWTTMLVGGVSAERVNGSFLHLPNLVFHEAGHILFSPFGHFMTVLGGSLTQVLIPLACAGAFLWQARDPFGAAVAIWWAGENLLDVAPYINDARELKLVLLGGRTGAEVEGHDWEYLLNAMGIAHKDHTIAAAVQALGTLIMIAGLAWSATVVVKQLGARWQENRRKTGQEDRGYFG
jgi:hypothetical protein